jgi:hypothetical protein
MGAIAATQVSSFPANVGQVSEAGAYDFGVDARRPGRVISRCLQITGVTAGDTATAAVLGFSQLVKGSVGVYGATVGNPGTPFVAAVDVLNNELVVGTGPANQTLLLTVEGAPTVPPNV